MFVFYKMTVAITFLMHMTKVANRSYFGKAGFSLSYGWTKNTVCDVMWGIMCEH